MIKKIIEIIIEQQHKDLKAFKVHLVQQVLLEQLVHRESKESKVFQV
jgi:hypothetical protein